MKKIGDRFFDCRPKKWSSGAAGFDLVCAKGFFLYPHETVRIPAGVALEIPEGLCGVVYPRSSAAAKGFLIVPTIVDSDYRGEVHVVVTNSTSKTISIHEGSRIAQIKFERVEAAEIVEVESLGATERGGKGFGSTGE